MAFKRARTDLRLPSLPTGPIDVLNARIRDDWATATQWTARRLELANRLKKLRKASAEVLGPPVAETEAYYEYTKVILRYVHDNGSTSTISTARPVAVLTIKSSTNVWSGSTSSI